MKDKKFYQDDVDKWVRENNEYTADLLLYEQMPSMPAKLDRLAKRMNKLLEEIKETFPDAVYYTASGGFTLVLGNTHD